ncbi:hypothetical protein RAD10_17220 [Bradyrhizobium sp. 23AC]
MQGTDAPLGQLAFGKLPRDERSAEPGVDVGMEIQSRLVNDVPPFAGKTVEIDLSIARRQREGRCLSETASDRHGDSRADAKGCGLIKELTLCSRPHGRTSSPTPAKEVALGLGTENYGIKLLISKIKIAVGPGLRVGRDEHGRLAGQAQIGKSLKAEPLREPRAKTFECVNIARRLDCVSEFLERVLDRIHSVCDRQAVTAEYIEAPDSSVR